MIKIHLSCILHIPGMNFRHLRTDALLANAVKFHHKSDRMTFHLYCHHTATMLPHSQDPTDLMCSWVRGGFSAKTDEAAPGVIAQMGLIPAGCPLQLSHWSLDNDESDSYHGPESRWEELSCLWRLNQPHVAPGLLWWRAYQGSWKLLCGTSTESLLIFQLMGWIMLPHPPNNLYVEVLNLSTCECDLIWR